MKRGVKSEGEKWKGGKWRKSLAPFFSCAESMKRLRRSEDDDNFAPSLRPASIQYLIVTLYLSFGSIPTPHSSLHTPTAYRKKQYASYTVPHQGAHTHQPKPTGLSRTLKHPPSRQFISPCRHLPPLQPPPTPRALKSPSSRAAGAATIAAVASFLFLAR